MTENEPVLRLEKLQKYFQEERFKDGLLDLEHEPIQAIDAITIEHHYTHTIGVIDETPS